MVRLKKKVLKGSKGLKGSAGKPEVVKQTVKHKQYIQKFMWGGSLL